MEADSRFLTLGHLLWNVIIPFQEMTLQTSYRLTKPIAKFVNTHMLEMDLIKAHKPGPKVDLVVCNAFDPENILDYILPDLKSQTIKPSDIFVLAGSIKSEHTPIKKLENWITEGFAQELDPDLQFYSGDQYLEEGKSNFGVFTDSCPDRWGRILMQRREAILARQDSCRIS